MIETSYFNVSIVIPVKNGLHWLKYSIPKMLNQEGINRLELIIIDSGSSDGIEDFLTHFSDSRIKYYKIESSDFGHGKTRNLGVQLSVNEYIVFTVQDAIPVNNDWLVLLISPMIEHNLDAICGKQIVLDNLRKNPIEWNRPVESPTIKIIELNPTKYNELLSKEKKVLTGWDNVNAAYKKSILLKQPFSDVTFGEDAYWADTALKSNLKIAYNGFSLVDHYHHYNKQQFFERYLSEFFLNEQLYGLLPQQKKINLKIIFQWIYRMLRLKINFFDIPYWINYNLLAIIMYNRSVRHFSTLNKKEKFILIKNNNPISTSNIK